MGKALHDAYPEARAVFAEADEALGIRCRSLLRGAGRGADADARTRSRRSSRPASRRSRVLAARAPMRPSAVAGHSLGEYTRAGRGGRAVASPTRSRLVHLRGKFMQEAVPAGLGAMAAIMGLSRMTSRPLCREAAGAEVVSAGELERRRPGA